MVKELQLDDSAPWKQRFRVPITRTQLAEANPTRGLAASNRSGVFQLYAWDVPTGELRQLTDRPDGRIFGVLDPDGGHSYYLDDQQGNEIGHYVRVPFEGGKPQDITPDMPPYSSWSLTFSRSGELLGLLHADAEGYHVSCGRLGPNGTLGELRRLYDSRSATFGPVLSHGGEVAAVAWTEAAGGLRFRLTAYDTSTGNSIGELTDGPESSVEAVMFSPLPGDLRLLATTDRTGVTRPLIWNPQTGEREDLALPGLEGEVRPVDWSDDGRRVLLCHFAQAVQRYYIYDLAEAKATRLEHPDGTYGGVYFGPDGEIFAHWQDSTHPTQLIALDAETGRQKRTVLPTGEVPPGRPWQPVSFKSSDGQEIQGWLGVPEGDGPFPTILDTHGGPAAVTTEAFSAGSQAWLDHGFAFLTINYRGSTTFGKEFEEKIWGDLGHWEVEDMVAAREWLVEQGITDPGKVFLTGWSYGGYLTLQALGKYPDLWAGGMAGIAIADWAIQYEDTAETLKGIQVALLGGTPEENPEQYARSSPITYAENVSAPVLIIQGRNDTRTPARPVEMYERKMQDLGKPIEVHWFETGHAGAFMQVEQSIQHQERMLRFAYKVLGEH